MTNIAEMLTPEQREVLAALAAHAEVNGLAPVAIANQDVTVLACECKSRSGFTMLPGTTLAVCAECGWPTSTALKTLGKAYAEAFDLEGVGVNQLDEEELDEEESHVTAEEIGVPDLPPVTTINGVDVDLRSDGTHETTCADCGVGLEVEIKPKGVDLEVLTSLPRVAVCAECGRKRVEGKRGVLVVDATYVPKHALPYDPAKDGPVEKPKAKAKKAKAKKEEPVPQIDLTEFSNAELAQLAIKARERAVAKAAEELPKKAKKAKKKEAKRVAKDEALKVREREARKVTLPEFTIRERFVPALDLSEVSNLNEAVSAKMRSPYNKALHALGMALLDREATTYEVLAGVHGDLLAMTEPEPKAKKKVTKASKQARQMGAKVPGESRLIADLEPDAQAKVTAFAKVQGVSYDEARKHLASLNLV